MNKRFIATALAVTILSSNIPTISFATSDTTVNKESIENLKVYKKTSLKPQEDKKKFNSGIHTNEPLGLEILEATEIDILIEGDQISGTAGLNLHNVDNLNSVQTIKVGEKATVKIPSKGQLFLDVSNIKYNSEDVEADFSFNVKITLDETDYEITPTYDMRENKLSDKVMQDEDEFEKAISSDENKEQSALFISENVRIHVPLSKHIPKNIDASDTLDNHERIISKFNELAGLDESNPDERNRPREGFFLVSGRNQHVGYMSAGGLMLDTNPRNINEYFKKPTAKEDPWGMYHEYGHFFEQGWGFQEYWNNIFANMLRREDFNSPNWAWLYGNTPYAYETKSLLTSYETYLKTGKAGRIHPMYFFLQFIDNMDKDFMAKLETFYRENDISFGGWDYIAYFIAHEYKLNVIPYIEATGEVGHSVKNKKAREGILREATSTFMYMPEDERFDEVRNISMPPTLNNIYSGNNRVISGMSNPNATVKVSIQGKVYEIKADENGKFAITIKEHISANTKITVTSTEEGKLESFARELEMLDENAKVSLRGYESKEFLSLTLNNKTKKFEAKSSGEAANKFISSEYIRIEHYSKKGKLRNKFSINGKQNADNLAQKLNETSFIEGDYLKFYHKEQQGRLAIIGDILNQPFLLENGVKNLNLNETYFYIQGSKLAYSDEILDLDANRDDLKALIDTLEYKEEDYTKTSFDNYTDILEQAKQVVLDESTTNETISMTYELLEKSIENLKKVNKVLFQGYNNNVFLELGFDTQNKKITAKSNNEKANSYVGSGVYAKITHYDKKGVEKGTYSVRANETGENVANALNNLSYIEGDYLKFYHREQNSRLDIKGHVVNSPQDLSGGVGNLNLNDSLFYMLGENLEYSNKPLDLSANKNDLEEKIKQAKEIKADTYTKSTYENLQSEILKSEELIDSTNVYEEEINLQLQNLENAINNLRKVNNIEFKGYDNKTFMTLKFDTENNKFKAESNGDIIHPYQYSKVYAKVEHFDKKGNLKGKYQANANQTADKMAEDLNNATFTDGDYLKLSHLEKNNRLKINGYVENAPYDLSTGSTNLDLDNSYFYLNGESLEYSNKQLDLSSDKKELVAKIEEAKVYTSEKYTKTSFNNLQNVIAKSEELLKATNVYEEEINKQIEELQNAISNLKELNTIVFRGYNNNEFLKLSFDSNNNEFKAVSNGQVANKFIGGKYAQVTHYDKKGNVKGTYALNGSQTADDMAAKLNDLQYVEGDYLKLFHAEPNIRLKINGYVENAPYDLSTGAGNLDLNNSYFYLNGESLEYSNKQLDLSADKKDLVAKIEEAKAYTSDKYTKTSFNNLQNVIAKSEELLKVTNVNEEEINKEIENLENAIYNLKELNVIVFRGYNNNEFLKLSFDSNNNEFKAVSNGQVANKFIGGKYAQVTHYDKKGNVKGTYALNGSQTADDMAAKLNNLQYVEGDYLKLFHAEPNIRLKINGYVENAPYDLSTGAGNLDLNNSYFYLNGESLEYSNSQLDLSADKKDLVAKIEEAKAYTSDKYTKTSFNNLQSAIAKAEELLKVTNVNEEEINKEIEDLENTISNLKELNLIEFKGYDNEAFMTLEFDTENNKFKAESNGKMVHPYQYSKVYAKVEHFDKKGNSKGLYQVAANQNADDMANKLNDAQFEDGDYVKIYHLEKNNRLKINGYVENAPYDLSTGSANLDLNNSYFYLNGESLEYSNSKLDLSADKAELIKKINEVKEINGENYTSTSFENLTNEINKAEVLINTTNVDESEIKDAIQSLTDAVQNLREINVIEFKGYDNVVFLKLGFDKVNNKFIATSNGKMVHPYQYSNVYSTLYHYDKDGNLKGEYSVRANETADEMADALNLASISTGDYIKLSHLEQRIRLAIKGHINNYSGNLGNGVGDLNLGTTIFNLDEENLTYIAQ